MVGANLGNLLTLIAQRNSLDGIIMNISSTLIRMQDAAAKALELLYNQQDIENQAIQVKLDGLTGDEDNYTEQYQQFLTEQQKLTQKHTREVDRLKAEWDTKERPYEQQKEDRETEREAINADIEGMREITKENTSSFGMFNS